MRLLLIAVAFAVSFECHAQGGSNVSLEMCGAFSNSNIIDKKDYMSADYKYQQHYDMVCRSTQNDTDKKFNWAGTFAMAVKYIDATGSLDYSSKKSYVDGYCRHLQSMSHDEKGVVFSTQQFSDNMRDTVKACFDVVRDVSLNRSGIFAYSVPNNSQLTEYVVSVEVKPRPVQEVLLTGFGGNATCTFRAEPVSFPMALSLNGENDFHCQKPQDEGTFLSIHTSSLADTRVRMEGKSDMKIVAMQSQLDSLSSILLRQANRKVVLEDCDFPAGSPYNIVGLGWGVEGKTNMWNRMDHPVDADCPSGQVIVGVNSAHHNGYEDRQFRYKCCTVTLSD